LSVTCLLKKAVELTFKLTFPFLWQASEKAVFKPEEIYREVKNVPPDLIAFTVNIPMFEQIITMDDNNFLNKSFWKRLRKAREKD